MRSTSLLAAMLLVLGGCESGSDTVDPTPTPTPNSYEVLAGSCVDQINEYRATLALAPYAHWESADICSNGEAEGDDAAGAAHASFGDCGEMAQNECPNWPLPIEDSLTSCLAAMWAEGPGDFENHGHYINMSSTSYTKAACGFFVTSDDRVWIVQNFQ